MRAAPPQSPHSTLRSLQLLRQNRWPDRCPPVAPITRPWATRRVDSSWSRIQLQSTRLRSSPFTAILAKRPHLPVSCLRASLSFHYLNLDKWNHFFCVVIFHRISNCCGIQRRENRRWRGLFYGPKEHNLQHCK